MVFYSTPVKERVRMILLNDRVVVKDKKSIFWGAKGKVIHHKDYWDGNTATIKFDHSTEGYVQYVFRKKQLKKI
jgi:hypothetical protein